MSKQQIPIEALVVREPERAQPEKTSSTIGGAPIACQHHEGELNRMR